MFNEVSMKGDFTKNKTKTMSNVEQLHLQFLVFFVFNCVLLNYSRFDRFIFMPIFSFLYSVIVQ